MVVTMDYVRHYRNLGRAAFKHYVKGRSETDPQAMVIDDARALYIPIPKAANSSARRALSPSVHIPIGTVGDVHQDDRFPIWRWSDVCERVTADWYVFTVVRNPYTRIQSAYRDKMVKMGVKLLSLQTMGLEAGDSFNTFLAACARWPRKMLNDHFIPQTDLLSKPLATGNLHVVKSEDLPNAWSQVADRVAAAGAPRPAEFGHSNRSEGGPGLEFTPKQVALIRKLYRHDFDCFEYSEEPPRM